MRVFRITCSSALVLVLAALAASAISAAASQDHWKGRPDFEAGEAIGYFIWQDDNGWHARWTTKGEKSRTFSGSITCDGDFTQFEAVKKDRRDMIKKDSDSRLRFDTKTQGGIDGLDFRLSPSTRRVTFDLKIDGAAAEASQVRLGAKKERPSSVPFTIDRGADATASTKAKEAQAAPTTKPAPAKPKQATPAPK